MIISLTEAQKLDPEILQEDIDAFEQSVRQLTNNNFQNTAVRFDNVALQEPNLIKVKDSIKGLRIGDTLEVNYSSYNDGLYKIEEIHEDSIKVAEESFLEESGRDLMITLVQYPADIKKGIKKLIEYDKKMANKAGIKSETISRMSTTYYDVTAAENTDGYPSNLLSFLMKYKKMRW
ncbi:hypothetical protein ACEN4P_01450 [Marinilactibacillus psychrotolerans]|uniref:hypothetical protein n=1 Tax=Marinilactibacillus psychrotolerans TaxID=191770 RepID=UPI0038868529